MKRYAKHIIFGVAFLFLAITVSAKELGISIKDKSFSGKYILVNIDLSGNISYDTIEAIRNGITAKVYITLQLLKSGGFINIGQGTLSQRTVSFTLSYDVWENKFIVKSKALKKAFKLKDPSKITSLIEESVNPIKLSLKSAKKGYKLILRSKLEIQTIKLYPPFGIFLYFFDPWNYETKWTYSESFVLRTR